MPLKFTKSSQKATKGRRPKSLVKHMHQKGIKIQSQGARIHTSRHDIHTKTCAHMQNLTIIPHTFRAFKLKAQSNGNKATLTGEIE